MKSTSKRSRGVVVDHHRGRDVIRNSRLPERVKVKEGAERHSMVPVGIFVRASLFAAPRQLHEIGGGGLGPETLSSNENDTST